MKWEECPVRRVAGPGGPRLWKGLERQAEGHRPMLLPGEVKPWLGQLQAPTRHPRAPEEETAELGGVDGGALRHQD